MDTLIYSLDNPRYYDSKLILLFNILPLIKKTRAKEFMKIFEKLLKEQKSDSLFEYNSNPIAVGLLLLKVIDEIHHRFNYSQFAVDQMKH